MLGLDSNASTRIFTLSTPLLTLGIFNTDRNDASRTAALTVTYFLTPPPPPHHWRMRTTIISMDCQASWQTPS
jgi:hypothetical protein